MDWKRFFDSLGMNGTRWQWRIMKWQRQWQQVKQGEGVGNTDFSISKILLFINLLLFSIMVLRGATQGGGMSTLLSPSAELLVVSGGQWWPLVIQNNEWWRCITYAYTHAGLIHIGFNMMVLYQVGPQLEREIGPSGFISLYTLTAFAATGLGYFWHPMTVVIGASGALFGMIGFSITYFHRIGGHHALAQRDFMIRWAVFAFIFGFMVRADNAAHLGGAVSGAVFGLVFPIALRTKRALAPVTNTLAIVSLLATVVSLAFLVLSWF
ncbi:MAG: rhomboid family intramembrane serine protease [Desulfuromonas sp.]|nr:MAG: rhomboid family intramembrane serine protease [Desulfuromonas sp.]